jgi:hypothetical protein
MAVTSSIQREELGGTAHYVLSGRFDGKVAFDLAKQLGADKSARIVLDFSQIAEFADYGVAVLSQHLGDSAGREIHFRGLRQHQLRLFQYFGVDVEALARPVIPGPAGGSVEAPPRVAAAALRDIG